MTMTLPRFLILTALLGWNLALAAGEPSSEPILRIETGFHSAAIWQVDAAVDGTVLTVSHDNTARLWRMEGHRFVQERVIRMPFESNQGTFLRTGAISPDGHWVALGGWGFSPGKYFIFLFDRRTGIQVRRMETSPCAITHLRFRPDGQALVACLESNGIRVFAPATGAQLWEDRRYWALSPYACWLPGGALATTCWDGRVRFYDSQGQLRHTATTLTGKQPGSIASDGADLVAVGFMDTTTVERLRVSDGQNQEPLDTRGINGGNLAQVAWHAGEWWAGGIHSVEVNAGTWIHPTLHWPSHGRQTGPSSLDEISDLTPLPGRPLLAVGAADKQLLLLDAQGQTVAHVAGAIPDFFGQVKTFATSADGRRVRIGSRQWGQKPILIDMALGSLADSLALPADCATACIQAPGLDIREWENSNRPTLNGRALHLFSSETSHSLAITPNGQLAVLGGLLMLRAFDRQGKELWEQHGSSPVWDVIATGDGRSVVAAYGNGTIRWHRLCDGKEYLALFVHAGDRRWVAWTPSGYYWASSGAEELIGWHVNRGMDHAPDFFPTSRFADHFNRPDVVKRCLEAAQPDTELAQELGLTQTIAQAVQGVPRVRITAPDKVVTLPAGTEQTTVEAAIEDTGGGIDEVRVLVNGKALDGTNRGMKAKAATSTWRWDIPLVPGTTEVTVTAFSSRRTESLPATVTITVPERKASAALYGITIAVNDYQNPRYRLDGPVPDAEALVKTLDATAKPLFGGIHWTHLRNAQATRSAIQDAFAAVQKQARPQDTLLVFYAGHGVMEEPESGKIPKFYLVTPDILQMYGHDDDLAAKAVSADLLRDWCRAIPAQKQVLLMDACQAGGAVETIAMRGAAEERALAMLSRSAGATVIAAAGAQESATEIKALGHGVFTYALLQGLAGKARTGDRPVTVRGLDAWLSQTVPELTKQHRTQMQVPTSCHRGQDFPLALPVP